jgi:uncharacterized protein
MLRFLDSTVDSNLGDGDGQMALKDQIQNELKQAMLAGDYVRRDALRGLVAAISNAEIARVDTKDESATRQGLPDEEVLAVVQKLTKQRRESIEEFKKGHRDDLVAKEESDLQVLLAYLPAQLGRDEIATAVRAIIAETGAAGPGDKPKVMPKVMAQLKGRADGRLINEVVTELLRS